MLQPYKSAIDSIPRLTPRASRHDRLMSRNAAGVTVGELLQFRLLHPEAPPVRLPTYPIILHATSLQIVPSKFAPALPVSAALQPASHPVKSTYHWQFGDLQTAVNPAEAASSLSYLHDEDVFLSV